jgi:hypothetical protein
MIYSRNFSRIPRVIQPVFIMTVIEPGSKENYAHWLARDEKTNTTKQASWYLHITVPGNTDSV